MFWINATTFNISIDSSSLNIFTSWFLHLLQIESLKQEIPNAFSDRCDILIFYTANNAI